MSSTSSRISMPVPPESVRKSNSDAAIMPHTTNNGPSSETENVSEIELNDFDGVNNKNVPKSINEYVSYVSNDAKRRLAEYVKKDIEVNHELMDPKKFTEQLRADFDQKHKIWNRKTKIFKGINFIVTLTVLLIQLAEVIVFQVSTDLISLSSREAIATIFPALTGALVGIQLKLAWSSKARKAKKNAVFYKKMLNHMEGRNHVTNSGGEFFSDDLIKLWNLKNQTEYDQFETNLYCC